jgi:CRISPR/Cas system-associated exonuclease Cas4 (RecB family)
MTTTSALLLAYDRKRARSKQDEFGISEIGGCRRRAGYRLAHTPPSDAGGSVQAAMGGAIHEAVASAMTQVAEPGDLVEHEVWFAGILGHLDRYEAATATVCDTKTTSSRWAEHIQLHGPDEPHLWQVNLYGAALVRTGREVRRVRIDYLARDTGDEWSWEGPFRPELVRAALAWLRNVQQVPLDMLPRDYMPDSAFCHSCKFASLCWPYGLEGKGPARVLLAELEGADKAADELWQAKQDIAEAKQREERARLALEALRPLQGVGLVDAGEHRLRFGLQQRGGKAVETLRFAPKTESGRQPAVGYEEGDG